MNLFRIFWRSRAFVEVLNEYFRHISVGLKPSTHEKHKFFYNNIEAFFKERDVKITLAEITPAVIEELRIWLYTTRHNCSREHASRHIKHCKAAFRYAVKLGYSKSSPIEHVETDRDKTGLAISLTAQEVAKLLRADYKNSSFELTLDLFLFQCFTGLSYMDLWIYEVLEEGGVKWVTSLNGRGKNGKKYWSEFNDYAKSIHEKYNGHFPEITNQAYNRTIKAIAVKERINKDLSSHNARKTFATLKYKQGYSLEAIADQLGNDPETTRKHYITQGNERIKTEMKRLAGVPFIITK